MMQLKTRNQLFEDIRSRQAQEALEHEARRQRALQKIHRLREDLRAKRQKEKL